MGMYGGLLAGLRARRADDMVERKQNEEERKRLADERFRQEQADRAQANADRTFTQQQANADRQFAFQQSQADRAQTNADRTFGLQQAQAQNADRRLSLAESNSKLANERADRELQLKEEAQDWNALLNEDKHAVFKEQMAALADARNERERKMKLAHDKNRFAVAQLVGMLGAGNGFAASDGTLALDPNDVAAITQGTMFEGVTNAAWAKGNDGKKVLVLSGKGKDGKDAQIAISEDDCYNSLAAEGGRETADAAFGRTKEKTAIQSKLLEHRLKMEENESARHNLGVMNIIMNGVKEGLSDDDIKKAATLFDELLRNSSRANNNADLSDVAAAAAEELERRKKEKKRVAVQQN